MITVNSNYAAGTIVCVLIKTDTKEVAISEALDPARSLKAEDIDDMVEKAKNKAKEHIFGESLITKTDKNNPK